MQLQELKETEEDLMNDTEEMDYGGNFPCSC